MSAGAPSPQPPVQQGLVFDVQRFSIHDGPGIRTVVFFKGCGLDCKWCQNPEGRRRVPELSYHADRCVAGCSACVQACPEQALLDRVDDRVRWAACTHCGACIDPCPSGALEIVGELRTVDDLLGEILLDQPFHAASGGGLTLSGGEPVLHAAFLAQLLPKARAAGLHVALETGGQYRFEALEGLLPLLDLVLYDVKAGGRERHLKLVGHDDRQIQDNLRRLLRAAPGHGVEVEVRMPVVPGLNDGDESVEILATELSELGVEALTLLAYNHLWEAKIPRLDTPRVALGIGARDRAYYEELADRFSRLGIAARLDGAA